MTSHPFIVSYQELSKIESSGVPHVTCNVSRESRTSLSWCKKPSSEEIKINTCERQRVIPLPIMRGATEPAPHLMHLIWCRYLVTNPALLALKKCFLDLKTASRESGECWEKTQIVACGVSSSNLQKNMLSWFYGLWEMSDVKWCQSLVYHMNLFACNCAFS